MKRTALIAVVMVLALSMAISGTIAYLTDTDSDVNVMTLGNVKIDQVEYQRVVDEDGNWVSTGETDKYGYTPDKLEPFVDNKPLYPAYFADGVIKYDDRVADHQQSWGQVSAPGSCYLFDDSVVGALDKFVFVKNTGSSDAYVRTWIALEQGSVDADKFADIIMTNSDQVHWSKKTVACDVEIGGNEYAVLCYTYLGPKSDPTGILAAGDTSYPSLMQVYMMPEATNEDVQAIDGNGNGVYEVLVFTQAMQTKNFENVAPADALNVAFGEDHPWADVDFEGKTDVNVEPIEVTQDQVLTDKPFYSNYSATDSYTINGNGHTITMVASSVQSFDWINGTIPLMANIFSSEDGALVTVNDLTITGTMQAVMAGNYVNSSSNWFNTVFNNVNIVDAEVVSFSANISPALVAYGNLTMNNCNVTGTTLSLLDTDPMWPVYDVAAVNYSNVVVNNSKIGSFYMWNQAKVTLADGADVETVIVRGNMNTTKYGLVVKAGATVDAIDLSAITNSDRINITIEEGATVGKFIDNGVEYDTIDAWKAAQ